MSARKAPGADDRRHPRNPLIGAGFAALLLFGAVSGFLPMIAELQELATGADTRRAELVAVSLPVVFGGLGVATLVRAIRAWRPWSRYLRTTDVDARRADRAHDLDGQRILPIVLIGAAGLVAQVLMLVLVPLWSIPTRIGQMVYLEIQTALLLVWLSTLGLAAQTLGSRR